MIEIQPEVTRCIHIVQCSSFLSPFAHSVSILTPYHIHTSWIFTPSLYQMSADCTYPFLRLSTLTVIITLHPPLGRHCPHHPRETHTHTSLLDVKGGGGWGRRQRLSETLDDVGAITKVTPTSLWDNGQITSTPFSFLAFLTLSCFAITTTTTTELHPPPPPSRNSIAVMEPSTIHNPSPSTKPHSPLPPHSNRRR